MKKLMANTATKWGMNTSSHGTASLCAATGDSKRGKRSDPDGEHQQSTVTSPFIRSSLDIA
jgi:hypothetical protein